MPIGLNVAWLALTPPTASFAAVFGKGELLGLSLGYASNSVYDLVFKKPNVSTIAAFAVMACYSMGVGSAGLFGLVFGAYALDAQIAGGFVASISVGTYILTLLLSVGCVVAIEG